MHDKYRGCLVGGAIGDALGYSVEFMSWKTIQKIYGESGISEYSLSDGIALISDDTQMTIFTAAGLLYGETRGAMRGIMGSPVGYLAIAYKDWYLTQTENQPEESSSHTGIYYNFPELWDRRAPGNTCIHALKNPVNDAKNISKGCGGIMRVAPIGLWCHRLGMQREKVFALGVDSAAITHGHWLGRLPAGAMAMMVHDLLSENTADLYSIAGACISFVNEHYGHVDDTHILTSLMEKAVKLSMDNIDDIDAITALGEGWVAEETLAIGLYCALKYKDNFERVVCASVNHSGDSDSTGVIAGNLCGLLVGYDTIPAKYKQNLELHQLLVEISDDLLNGCQCSEYGNPPTVEWDKKYMGKA